MGLFDFGKIKRLEKQNEELKRLAGDAFQNVRIANIQSSISGSVALFPDYNIGQSSNRYATSDDIYSIVRMLATTAALIPIRAYEIVDEKSAKKLHQLARPHTNILRTKALEIKALQDLAESDGLNQLIESPSDILSKFEFFEALYSFLYLFGEAFILKQRPEFGVNSGKPTNLLFLYPNHVNLRITGTLPRRVIGYDYKVEGNTVFENIPFEDVIHIKYFNPELTFSGSELRGLSTIKVLAQRLTMNDSNLSVSTAQMQNGGVSTVLYEKGLTGEEAPEVLGKRKDNFYKFLQNPANAGSPYMASGELGVLHIGSNLADLKIIENANITFKKLCNAFGTSDILFNNGEAATESNVQEMVMRTYTNTVLPNVYRVRDALKKGLLMDFKDRKRDLREDISEIQELQPNSKEMADWLSVAWWVTPNEHREMMRFDVLEDETFNQPLLPSGLQNLTDIQGIDDLPIITEDGN